LLLNAEEESPAPIAPFLLLKWSVFKYCVFSTQYLAVFRDFSYL